MDKEQRKQLEDLLIEHPEWANNLIADHGGWAHGTVKAYRKRLEAENRIPALAYRVRRDGMQYAAVRTRKAAGTIPAPEIIDAPELTEEQEGACRALMVVRERRGHPELEYLALDCTSETVRRGVTYALNKAAGFFGHRWNDMPWEDVNTFGFAAIVAGLKSSGLASSTCRNNISHVKGVLRRAAINGLIEQSEWTRIEMSADHVKWPGQEVESSRTVSAGEWIKIVDSLDAASLTGLQSLAMLAACFPLGCRASDIAALHPDNLTEVPSLMVWRTKTRRPRKDEIMLDEFPGVLKVLRLWWASRPEGRTAAWYGHVGGIGTNNIVDWDEPLLLETELDKTRSASTIGSRIKAMGRRAGLGDFSSKCGRVTVVTLCRFAKPPVPDLYRDLQLGHTDRQSAGAYTRVTTDDRRGAFADVTALRFVDKALSDAADRHVLALSLPTRTPQAVGMRLADTALRHVSPPATRLCANWKCPNGRAFTPKRWDQTYCCGACKSQAARTRRDNG